ncbi:MAG: hypothetical protein ABSH48_07275 [Verrucomicrobiota bacterium]|jgi:hypothetical protein
MKRCLFLLLAALAARAVGTAEPSLKVSVLDNAVLCLRASRVPDNVPEQIRAATVPRHLAGTVLDLRFADGAATNAADYFIHGKSPLVVLVNSQTRGAAAQLAAELRNSASAILIGSTNLPKGLSPDIVVAVSPEDERKFQDDPFLANSTKPFEAGSPTNLLAFVDHTSEADLVRKRIKDGDDEGDVSTPRAEPQQPVIRDPALARAADLLKALAALHEARG